MKLTYRPGKNPANVHQIRLFAGSEELHNLFITRAYRKQGKLTLEVEILDCEINREVERELSAEILEESGVNRGRTNQDTDTPSDPRESGAADKRHSLSPKRTRNRDNSKDQT